MKTTRLRTLALIASTALALTAAGCGHSIACDCHKATHTAQPAFADDFAPGWNQNQTDWEVATWEQNGAQMDPSRCRANDEGQIVQTVLAGEPRRGGSMQTTREFGYGRWVARVKPSSVPNVLNSVFTKDWDVLETEAKGDGSKFEVDIEFLTRTFTPSGGQVHLAIHAKVGDATKDKSIFHIDPELPFNPSDDYHEWGFDILPDVVIWHVDGHEIGRFPCPDDVVFNEGYEFFFNSWTGGKWVKGPPTEDADYHIDWVKFYPVGSMTPLKEPLDLNAETE